MRETNPISMEKRINNVEVNKADSADVEQLIDDMLNIKEKIDADELIEITDELSSDYFTFRAFKKGKILFIYLIFAKIDIPTTMNNWITGLPITAEIVNKYEFKVTPNNQMLAGLNASNFEGRANGNIIPANTYVYSNFILIGD